MADTDDVDREDPSELDDQKPDAERDPKPDDNADTDDPKILKARLREAQSREDRLKERLTEEETGRKYYYDRSKELEEAQAETARSQPRGKDKEPDSNDPLDRVAATVDLTELATDPDGFKKLATALRQAGMGAGISGAELEKIVDGRVEQKYQEVLQAGQLAGRHPDLANPESEFSKAVGAQMTQLRKDPRYKGLNHTALAEIASDRVELTLTREGKGPKRESENDREARINRQSGGQSRKSSSKSDDDLTEEQKYVARRLGVSEEDYRKSAKEGVTVHRRF